MLWLTSLWGGFSPSLIGWLVGLAAIAVEVPLERRWRRWREAWRQRRHEAARAKAAARRQAELEGEQREAGVAVLNPAKPPADADSVVINLCSAKQRLLDVRRPDLAIQADRLYTRYVRALDSLGSTFDAKELTYDRARGMIAEVSSTAIDNLGAMASLASGIGGIDLAYVERRLAGEGGIWRVRNVRPYSDA
ncbi:hypothetical protein [Alkalilimnicola ehrlichii]|uniref:hypothetical protein n=1 Tax=Alkalilimnicola ehrlichii TaxID=351052 RepID=UPI002161E47D|nr:hypothetical protein [Alkalilimnicola ehrlichii]